MRKLLDLLATVVQAAGFEDSANALVTNLAVSEGLARASLGIVRGSRVELAAISHAAAPGPKGALARQIEAAMEETLDLGPVASFPAGGEGTGSGAGRSQPAFAPLHSELSRAHGSRAVLSLPLLDGGRVAGVLAVEREGGEPMNGEEIAFFNAILGLAGPMILARRKAERPFSEAAACSGRVVGRLFGSGHPASKAAVVLVAVAASFLWLGTGEHRIAAKTHLEGEVQRAAVAPFDGYVAEAPARAGDRVDAGSLLCRIEDRELQLEVQKWKSQEEQLLKLHRKALAGREAAEARVLSAQLRQAQVQLRLAQEHLARTRVLSPIQGIVVRGDLSQSIGGPVRRGDVLFEIAPLDSYRVVFEVDDRDMAHLQRGQRGAIVLAALPGEKFTVTVERITPVSFTRDARNRFRLEATLNALADPRLRPGMEGVGKIEVGHRSLAWIWTHEAFDWLRLKVWSWLP